MRSVSKTLLMVTILLIILNFDRIENFSDYLRIQGYQRDYYEVHKEEIDKYFQEEKEYVENSTFYVDVVNVKSIDEIKNDTDWEDKNGYSLNRANLKIGGKYYEAIRGSKYKEVEPKNPVLVDTRDYCYYKYNHRISDFEDKDISKYAKTTDNKKLQKSVKQEAAYVEVKLYSEINKYGIKIYPLASIQYLNLIIFWIASFTIAYEVNAYDFVIDERFLKDDDKVVKNNKKVKSIKHTKQRKPIRRVSSRVVQEGNKDERKNKRSN